MKTLDMADRYPPAESVERDTLPPSDWEEDTLPSLRNPLLPKEEKTYPGIGLLIAFGGGALFWAGLIFLLSHC